MHGASYVQEKEEIKDILSRRHKHISREDWIASYDTVLRGSLSTNNCS